MFEKVNPKHPDKIADRIAGALVDLAYKTDINPKVAIEVLLGHGTCFITGESSYNFAHDDIINIVNRLAPGIKTVYHNINEQDIHLAENQKNTIKCGDNGIFKGVTVTLEQKRLSQIAKNIYNEYQSDGKYIINDNTLIICQSNATTKDLRTEYPNAIINPIGYWSGGLDVDAGATNRKLGSDMGDSITGGGLHGKDLSKADVSINIYVWLKAQKTGTEQKLYCAIGDQFIDGKPYSEIVEIARDFITSLGGFEKFAEWGLI